MIHLNSTSSGITCFPTSVNPWLNGLKSLTLWITPLSLTVVQNVRDIFGSINFELCYRNDNYINLLLKILTIKVIKSVIYSNY